MLTRVLGFFLFQLAGGALGYWVQTLVSPSDGLALGLMMGGALWVALDLRGGYRVLSWLKQGRADAPVHIPGLWRDVALRAARVLRQHEGVAQEAERRLQEFLSAIQASPNGVVLLDAQGRIEWCNQTAAEHFGFDLQRDLQQNIGNLVRDPAFMAYQIAGRFDRDVLMPGPLGTATRPIQLSVHLHAYGAGRRLLLSRDVTALEQADAMRRDFVANVSHEIRTPLTVLSGFVETLQTLPLDAPERQRYLDLMAQQAQRMQTLVSDLLTLSRLEGSPAPRADEWLPVQRLLARCEQDGRELSGLLSAQGHDWHFEIAPGAPGEVAGSCSELLSAMGNLVSNAVRYTPGGRRIEVSWRPWPERRAAFTVRDSGAGIAPEHLPRLTERFYRVDRSRSRDTGGTGLGLAIVKHVVQRHGGELHINSTPGQGSVFTIVMPASRLRHAGTRSSV